MSAKLNQILSGTSWILGLSAMGAITGRVNSQLVGRFLEKHVSSSGVLVAGELAFGAIALREIASLVIPADAALPVSDSIMWVFFFAASPTLQKHLQLSLQGLDAMLPGKHKPKHQNPAPPVPKPSPSAPVTSAASAGLPPGVEQQAAAAQEAIADYAQDMNSLIGAGYGPLSGY